MPYWPKLASLLQKTCTLCTFNSLVCYFFLNDNLFMKIYAEPKKETLIFLQELSVALLSGRQQILRAAIRLIISKMPYRCRAFVAARHIRS